ncbi:calcium-binding protein [Leptolyngbya sp. NK1-12]|uniref:Calcium-binding protein n=2 Tax=Leptolyngbya sp. NK1-12 TaxID=2547451 RepID=A0AA97AK71_9CYAN|nr:MAG: calcium-binding protein [Leptolyngbya sp. IPPAS B-1204]WNZ25741.1 calcium-binding protein [Leptolyngbya sp. NK1-12]
MQITLFLRIKVETMSHIPGYVFIGTPANDWIEGSPYDDLLDGLAGDDVLLGGAGNDDMYGGNGADWIEGQSGHDLLVGGYGNDVLLGGDGDDLLATGNPQAFSPSGPIPTNEVDQLYGGRGRDLFVIESDYIGSGRFIIHDLQYGERIDLLGPRSAYTLSLGDAYGSSRPDTFIRLYGDVVGVVVDQQISRSVLV